MENKMRIRTLILICAILLAATMVSAGNTKTTSKSTNTTFSTHIITQTDKYDALVGTYKLPELGAFLVYKKDGKLFGGPGEQGIEFVPVKGEKLKFEIYRNGALFAKAAFVVNDKKTTLILTVGERTSRADRQDKSSSKKPTAKVKLTVLKGLTLIDGKGGKPVPNVAIVLQGNKITDIIRSKRFPKNARIIDLTGKYITPGLIDAHVHMATDPSGSNNRKTTLEMLRHNLYGGVIAVRDMGGDARTLAGLARDANVNELESPNIYYSTIFAGPSFFTDPRTISSGKGVTPGKVAWMRDITPETNMPLVIAMAKGTSATGIKMYASLPRKELFRITAEAHKQGMQVWSHAAVSPALPLDAIEAGVDVLTHADLLAWQQGRVRGSSKKVKFVLDKAILKTVLDKMVEKNVILDATLYVFSLDGNGFTLANQIVAAAHKAGVQIAAGTDGEVDLKTNPFPTLYEEMKLLVNVGLTPLEAITSATLINAKAIGLEKTYGTIEIGKTANLVIFDKDPSSDLKNLKTVYLTIKNGQFYKRTDFANTSADNSLNPEQQKIYQTMKRFFGYMEAQNVEESRKLLVKGGTLVITAVDGQIAGTSTFENYLKSLKDQKNILKERVWNPTIVIDKNIATFISRYDFHINGKFSHCGSDIFNLVKNKGQWKIAGSLFSTQQKQCPKNPFDK